MNRSLPKGCRFHGRGIQASAFAAGHRAYQPFPLDTENSDIQAWQRQKCAELEMRYGGLARAAAGTFAADAARYLKSVTALADHEGRETTIALWVALFGTRRRHTIRPDEIRAQRDRWLTVGPKRRCVKGKGWVDVEEPLAPQTVCLRMRALENMWTVLDGAHNYNPVRDVPEPKTPKGKPRALPYDIIEAILAAMPDRGQGIRGKPRGSVSKTKARIRLMSYTGITRTPMIALTLDDFRMDPVAPAIRVKARGKGAGAEGGWIPVPVDAIGAMQAFIDADAWGRFSKSSLHKSFRRACKALGLPTNMSPYQLRHSYATAVVKQTGDLVAAQHALQHASPKTTMGYAEAEIDPWLAGAMAKVTGLRQRIVPDAK